MGSSRNKQGNYNVPAAHQCRHFGAVKSSAGLVCHIYRAWLCVNHWLWFNENSLLFKGRQKVAVFHLFWAESAKKSPRWHWGYLWLVNAHNCHVNAVGRLWWSPKQDYIWAGSTLNSHFVFRRHKEVWGLPNTIREISPKRAVLSAPLLCGINMEGRAFEELHVSPKLFSKTCLGPCRKEQNCRDPQEQLQSFPFPCASRHRWKTWKAAFQCQCEF